LEQKSRTASLPPGFFTGDVTPLSVSFGASRPSGGDIAM
jgi:hypothetical protein